MFHLLFGRSTTFSSPEAVVYTKRSDGRPKRIHLDAPTHHAQNLYQNSNKQDITYSWLTDALGKLKTPLPDASAHQSHTPVLDYKDPHQYTVQCHVSSPGCPHAIQISALLDTGSTETIVGSSFVKEFNITTYPVPWESISFIQADGQICEGTIESFCELDLTIGRHRDKV